jgi:signal transduction histidine kinase
MGWGMKSLYTKANEYLEALEFSKKTKLLIGIIALGMAAIGFFMLVSIFAIKYDYETLFQKRTLSQVSLEDIKDIYSVNIHDTLNDIKHHTIKTEDAVEVIESAIEIIRTQWKSYLSSSQRDIGGLPWLANAWLGLFLPGYTIEHDNYYQDSLLSKVKKKMQKIDAKSLTIIHAAQTKEDQQLAERIESLFLDINSINIYLSSLIKSHLKEAIAEKQRNDRMFNTSIIMLFLLIGFTFLLSILIALLIMNHFKRLNDSLESKVALKTKELRALNTSLEKRIVREVESSRKKDQVMFQQAKLASLGEMLQNIAHQWRQPLGALTMIIQGFEAKFLSGKLDKAFMESRVNDAMLLSKNMSDTLEDFRTFFHPHKIHKRFALRESIQKAIDLSKYQLSKEKIVITLEMKEDILIYGYENELTHILLNLINNSKDALSQTSISEKKILIIVKDASHHAIISVIDNAGGIKDGIITKIFEPYFTTKHKSVGTGIGLYMSKQIVEKHMNGKINCKNIQHKMGSKQGELQTCTMFTVEIPKENTRREKDG